MSTVLLLLIIIFILIFAYRIITIFSPRSKFYTTGLNLGFKIKEIASLWALTKLAKLEDPLSFYYSIPAINRSIVAFLEKSQNSGNKNSNETELLLDCLYTHRTKIELNPKNNNGMISTKSIEKGQRLRVLLKGQGVFYSIVINNSRELVISLPFKKNKITLPSSQWIGNQVSVYFRRYDDASYVFDTEVRKTARLSGSSVLYLAHSENILRTQKRTAIRSECSILGQIFFQNTVPSDHLEPENNQGLRCLVEDISENGALIRIGGEGKIGIHFKLQFVLNRKTVVMYGIVRSVEYNENLNQSRMHFQCNEISPVIKTHILNHVYNVIPQEQKDIFDAINFDAINFEEKIAEDPTLETVEDPTKEIADLAFQNDAEFDGENTLPKLKNISTDTIVGTKNE